MTSISLDWQTSINYQTLHVKVAQLSTSTCGLDFCCKYSQALVGDREDHAVSRLPLLLHLSVELLIQRFTSVCWSAALWLDWVGEFAGRKTRADRWLICINSKQCQ